jgi:hypothetical protein
LQLPLQHGVTPSVQVAPFGTHPGVVEVEVVLVEVLVVVVVVCARHVPPEQLPLQHWVFFVH